MVWASLHGVSCTGIPASGVHCSAGLSDPACVAHNRDYIRIKQSRLVVSVKSVTGRWMALPNAYRQQRCNQFIADAPIRYVLLCIAAAC